MCADRWLAFGFIRRPVRSVFNSEQISPAEWRIQDCVEGKGPAMGDWAVFAIGVSGLLLMEMLVLRF